MTRQEKIECIAGLINVNTSKQDINYYYQPTDEELHIKTLNTLEKLTDDELDIIIDKIWIAIKESVDKK